MTPKKFSACAAMSVVSIAMAWYVVCASGVAAQSSAEEADKATEPTSMNNKRLGKLLKKHFPKASFLQNGPNVWIVQFESEDEAKPTSEDADDAEAVGDDGPPTEDAAPADSDLHGKLLVITDERANRMRIMMPIQQFDPGNDEDLKTALIAMHANYDRALDARYAISEGILWSAFIHPLRSLTEEDLANALDQVQALRKNTGTTYSSGALIFGPAIKAAPDKEEDADNKKKDRTA